MVSDVESIPSKWIPHEFAKSNNSKLYKLEVLSGMESSVVDYVPDVQRVQAGLGSSVVDCSDIPCNY
jgi:hypothetical protein